MSVTLPVHPLRVPAAPSGATATGTYFVSNYPPFPAWSSAAVPSVDAVLDAPPLRDVPLGLYVHVPFCRKRCRFCYFKVTIGADSDEVRAYVDAVIAEAKLRSARRAIAGRSPRFVYVGGGTPSFLSASQLEALVTGLRTAFDWSAVEEFAFEAEPGTVSEDKLRMLKDLGVTRLSLGVESWDENVMRENGRAHDLKQALRAYDGARKAGIPQVNVDLIAGMVGETDASWTAGVARTIELAPESVTVYQVELPFNTVYSRESRETNTQVPVADWETKRRWVGEAFEAFERAGYTVGSGYTVARNSSVKFLYRDRLWHGADMLGLGVSAFSHVQGAHFQAEKEQAAYVASLADGRLPVQRGYVMDPDERLIRETILRLKLGRLDLARLSTDFATDARARFAAQWDVLARDGCATLDGDSVTLSRNALLQVDALLPLFFRADAKVPR